MPSHRPAVGRRHRWLALILVALSVLACQSTISGAKVLLDQTGSGSTKLPSFQSRGTYDVAYAYDTCTGSVTGLQVDALVGTGATPTTVLQTVAPDASGNVAGRQAGTITLVVTTHCHWKIRVTG